MGGIWPFLGKVPEATDEELGALGGVKPESPHPQPPPPCGGEGGHSRRIHITQVNPRHRNLQGPRQCIDTRDADAEAGETTGADDTGKIGEIAKCPLCPPQRFLNEWHKLVVTDPMINGTMCHNALLSYTREKAGACYEP